MKLLAIETSSSRGSLCLSELINGHIISIVEESWEKQSSHSEVISEVFLKLLKTQSWTLNELTHISVGIGPGSFTGIRVGVNFAKSLAYGLRLPILGINSLKILSAPHLNQPQPVLCIVNAYKNQVFVAAYQGKVELLPPSVFSLNEVEDFVKTPYLGLGDGLEVYRNELSPSFHNFVSPPESQQRQAPQADDIVTLIKQDLGPEAFRDWKSVNPLYIRSSSADEKLKSGALKPLPRF